MVDNIKSLPWLFANIMPEAIKPYATHIYDKLTDADIDAIKKSKSETSVIDLFVGKSTHIKDHFEQLPKDRGLYSACLRPHLQYLCTQIQVRRWFSDLDEKCRRIANNPNLIKEHWNCPRIKIDQSLTVYGTSTWLNSFDALVKIMSSYSSYLRGTIYINEVPGWSEVQSRMAPYNFKIGTCNTYAHMQNIREILRTVNKITGYIDYSITSQQVILTNSPAKSAADQWGTLDKIHKNVTVCLSQYELCDYTYDDIRQIVTTMHMILDSFNLLLAEIMPNPAAIMKKVEENRSNINFYKSRPPGVY